MSAEVIHEEPHPPNHTRVRERSDAHAQMLVHVVVRMGRGSQNKGKGLWLVENIRNSETRECLLHGKRSFFEDLA